MGSVTEAATSGTTRDLLVAMREVVAAAVDAPETPARDLAALTKRLREIVADIEAIDDRDAEESGVEIAPDEPFDPATV